VNSRRHQVTDPVNRHGALVRNDGEAPAPKAPKDEVIMRASWPFWKPIDTPPFPHPVAPLDMIVLKLLWIAGFRSLGSRKVSPLGNGKFVKAAPCVLWISLGHGNKKVA
jgi:hypothetical protein